MTISEARSRFAGRLCLVAERYSAPEAPVSFHEVSQALIRLAFFLEKAESEPILDTLAKIQRARRLLPCIGCSKSREALTYALRDDLGAVIECELFSEDRMTQAICEILKEIALALQLDGKWLGFVSGEVLALTLPEKATARATVADHLARLGGQLVPELFKKATLARNLRLQE